MHNMHIKSLMSPEFDPKKNKANIAKHGLSLSEAYGVLLDPLAITLEDSSAGERCDTLRSV